MTKETDMTNDPNTAPEETGSGSEDKGEKAGLAAILPLVIISVLVVLVLVYLLAR